MKTKQEVEGYKITDEQKSIIAEISRLNGIKKVLSGGEVVDDVGVMPELDQLIQQYIEVMPTEPKDFEVE